MMSSVSAPPSAASLQKMVPAVLEAAVGPRAFSGKQVDEACIARSICCTMKQLGRNQASCAEQKTLRTEKLVSNL